VLIDTSAWIEFFRTPDSAVGDLVVTLLRQARACYTGLIAVELYRGAKGHREFESLEQLFATIECLGLSQEAYRTAGRLCAQFARRGITVGTVDAMIATVAVEHDCALLSLDRHFKEMAPSWQLRLVQI
jgi:predicted nucleic acid-binding protein